MRRPNKSGVALEEQVAQYFREAGAIEVARDKSISGNQIDVFAVEETAAGARTRIIVECKDLARTVGVAQVNDFATIYAKLKIEHLVDSAWMVSSRGFSRFARLAAAPENILLLTVDDLRERKRSSRYSLMTILSSNDLVVLRPERTFLAYHSSQSIHTELAATAEHVIDDENNPKRVKLIGDYVAEIGRLSAEPSGTLVTVDLSGDDTAFSNWIGNPMYIAILQQNQRYAEAYRRRHGSNGIPVQRNFVIDPTHLTNESIRNFDHALRLHLRFGLVAGVIYKDSNIPSGVLSDMGILAERLSFDFGRAEAADPKDVNLLDVIATRGNAQFKQIRERVAWSMDPKNLDALVSNRGQAREVIKDLRERLRRHRS